jgi:hypothetical protein
VSRSSVVQPTSTSDEGDLTLGSAARALIALKSASSRALERGTMSHRLSTRRQHDRLARRDRGQDAAGVCAQLSY